MVGIPGRYEGPVRIRDCPVALLDARSARARRTVKEELDNSLLYRYYTNVLMENQCDSSLRSAKPIRTWTKQEISFWRERRHWAYPDPTRWRDGWKDDQSDDPAVHASADGSGAEVIYRTVAALLAVADGVLGNLVIKEEMGKQEWDGKYDCLSREWMEKRVRIGNSTVPRIVKIFQRLLDGFQRLRQVGWEKEERWKYFGTG